MRCETKYQRNVNFFMRLFKLYLSAACGTTTLCSYKRPRFGCCTHKTAHFLLCSAEDPRLVTVPTKQPTSYYDPVGWLNSLLLQKIQVWLLYPQSSPCLTYDPGKNICFPESGLCDWQENFNFIYSLHCQDFMF